MDFKHKFETETGNSIYSGNGQMLSEGSYSDDFVEYLLKQLTLYDVVGRSEQLKCRCIKDPLGSGTVLRCCDDCEKSGKF